MFFNVSIHAPHEGERPNPAKFILLHDVVSIHAPHEGERLLNAMYGTHSYYWVSIHAPHEGERPTFAHLLALQLAVSIHAPHEGERRIYHSLPHRKEGFNPRSPRGGATTFRRQ